MSLLSIKGALKTARQHVMKAHTNYGQETDSELMFTAHVKAAYVALSGNHDKYVTTCRDNGITTEDKEWVRELSS